MNDPADAMTMRSRARVGLVLRDKWRIESILGVGGMAVVYTATHTNNGRRVAIKVLHPELSMTAELRTRFLREGYVANKIKHPGAVGILDDDIAEDGSVFLVMELLEGETIEQRRIRCGGRLPPGEILSICDQVLDVLAAAHEAGVVHRDVKPDNIFLTRDGGVKLLDFGIARVRELQSRQATMTGAGAMGTPAFMPHEQARGRWELVGPKTDIWAMGATMFTLATGQCVHMAETVNEVLLAAMTKPARALASVEMGLPPAFCALIDRALAFEIAERWPDPRSMQVALRAAYQVIDDGPSTNRGLGEKSPAVDAGWASRAAVEAPRAPPEAMLTGPRPPPEAHPPPAAAPAPLQTQASPKGTQPFRQTPTGPSWSAVGPTGAAGAPLAASHATTHSVALGTSQQRARNRGAGVLLVAASVVSLAGAYGVYRLWTSGPPAPALASSAEPAPSEAPPPSVPSVASSSSAVEAPATASAVVAPSAAPSATASAEAAASSAPSATATARPGRVDAPSRPSEPPKPRPKRERDLLNRRN